MTELLIVLPGSSGETNRVNLLLFVFLILALFCSSVEMQAKEGESFTGTTVNETDINSAINGILEAAQGEDDGDEAVSDRLPAKLKRGTRSVIWRHFEHLVGLGAASCRICKKKLRCPDSSTSNLHRHMSKRHPLVSLRMGKLPPLLPASSARGSNVDRDATTMLARDQRDLSGKPDCFLLQEQDVSFSETCKI